MTTGIFSHCTSTLGRQQVAGAQNHIIARSMGCGEETESKSQVAAPTRPLHYSALCRKRSQVRKTPQEKNAQKRIEKNTTQGGSQLAS